MEDGQGERGGLAGAGLRDAEDVASGESEWHGLRLDRGRGRVVLLGERPSDRVGEAEALK